MPETNIRKASGNDQEKSRSTADFLPPGSEFYEICVRGHLDRRWSEWLEGLEVRLLENGEMILSGYIVDQAALMGILIKLNRLNLALRSLNEIRTKEKMEIKNEQPE